MFGFFIKYLNEFLAQFGFLKQGPENFFKKSCLNFLIIGFNPYFCIPFETKRSLDR